MRFPKYQNLILWKFLTWNAVCPDNLGICFFSPLKHGLLTGKHTEPVTFANGDHRTRVKEFQNPKLLEKMLVNKTLLEKRFSNHPNPVLHGLVDSLLFDVPTGCALLGQRNVQQVQAAATLGKLLTAEDAEWVKALYHFQH